MTEDINTSDLGSDLDSDPECRFCGVEFSTARWALGYKWCKKCGEIVAKQVVRTIVPMHKGHYFPCTNLEDLKGINNKGGSYR